MDIGLLMAPICNPGGCGGCGCNTAPQSKALPPSDYDPSKAPGRINTILIENGQATGWTNGHINAPSVVTWAFSNTYTGLLTAGPDSPWAQTYHPTGVWQPFTEMQMEGIREAHADHNTVSGVEFIEVADTSKAMSVWQVEEMRVGSGLGIVFAPGFNQFDGRVNVNIDSVHKGLWDSLDTMVDEGLTWSRHDTGHTLGLKHPFEGINQLPSAENNRDKSMMSHTQGPSGTFVTFQQLDRDALTYIYGTVAEKNALPVQHTQLRHDGMISTADDAGETVVGISSHNWERGGKGADVLIGGASDDYLDGGAGANQVYGNGGKDTLVVNVRHTDTGAYSLVFHGDTAQTDAAAGTISMVGAADCFAGITSIRFTDGTLQVGGQANSIAQMFNTVLGRPPTAVEFASVTHGLADGADRIAILQEIYKLDAFGQAYTGLTIDQQLTMIEHNVYGAQVTQALHDAHTAEIANDGGSLAGTLVTISNSPEAAANGAAALGGGIWMPSDTAALVARMEAITLDRPADDVGIKGLAEGMDIGGDTATDAANRVVNSAEGSAVHAGENNRAFASHVYATATGQQASEAVLNGLDRELAAGIVTRAGLVAALADDPTVRASAGLAPASVVASHTASGPAQTIVHSASPGQVLSSMGSDGHASDILDPVAGTTVVHGGAGHDILVVAARHDEVTLSGSFVDANGVTGHLAGAGVNLSFDGVEAIRFTDGTTVLAGQDAQAEAARLDLVLTGHRPAAGLLADQVAEVNHFGRTLDLSQELVRKVVPATEAHHDWGATTDNYYLAATGHLPPADVRATWVEALLQHGRGVLGALVDDLVSKPEVIAHLARDLSEGVFATSDTAATAARVHLVATGAIPDAAKVSEEALSLDAGGVSVHDLAARLVATTPAVSDHDFAVQAYHNAYGRDAPTAALTTWTTALGSGALDRVDLVVSFASSAEVGAIVGDGTAPQGGAGPTTALTAGNAADGFTFSASGGAVFAEHRSGEFRSINPDASGHTDLAFLDGHHVTVDGATTIQLADGRIDLGGDATAGIVSRLYSGVLAREADMGGLSFWTGVASKPGETIQNVVGHMLNSDEFTARFGTLDDQHFVQQLYHGVLGREGEVDGMGSHLADLAHGSTRAQVATDFVISGEATARYSAGHPGGVWVADPNAATVTDLFQAAFHRAPDEAGFAEYTGFMAHGTSALTVATYIAAGHEFAFHHASQTDTAFVQDLYHNVLGREGDAGGVAFHVAELGQGQTRAATMLEFATSDEHAASLAHRPSGSSFDLFAP